MKHDVPQSYKDTTAKLAEAGKFNVSRLLNKGKVRLGKTAKERRKSQQS